MSSTTNVIVPPFRMHWDHVISGAFWVLAAVVLFNLNGLGRMGLGVEQAFSLVILLCCVLLGGLASIPMTRALGLPGLLIVGSILSFIIIGSVAGFVTKAELRHDTFALTFSYIASVILIVAVSIGSHVVLRRIGVEKLLTILLIILTIDIVAILASPVLRDLYLIPPSTSSFRFTGTFGNPNEAGFVGCMTGVLALAFLWSRLHVRFALVALTLAAGATATSFSKTAVLTFIFAFVWFVLFSGRSGRRLALAWAFAMFVAGAVIIVTTGIQDLITNPAQLRRIDAVLSILSGEGVDNSTLTGRLHLWQLSWAEIMNSPVFGNGIGRLHSLEEARYGGQGFRLGAHNQYLTLWGEAGIIPLLLFIGFLVFLLKLKFTEDRSLAVDVAAGWALVLGAASMTSHNTLTMRFSDFLIGLSCALVAPVVLDSARR